MSQDFFEQSQELPVNVVENGKPKHDEKPKNTPERGLGERLDDLLRQERFWAATAHAMGPLAFFLMIVTDGFAWWLPVVATVGIYLNYRGKSSQVTFHARQALALQLIGTVGWIALVVGGTIAWVLLLLISLLLILVLVGLLLAPLVVLAYPVFLLASFTLPVSVMIFGLIGAMKAWQGDTYRIPYLARWLDRQFGPILPQIV